MRAFTKMIPLLVIVAGLTGCEWESSGDEYSWNDSYSWISWNGVYRSESVNSPVVREFVSTGTGDSGMVEKLAENEVQVYPGGGTVWPPNSSAFSSSLQHKPLVSQTVTLSFSDPATGASLGSVTDTASPGVLERNIIGTSGNSVPSTGTINYDTGAWAVQMSVDQVLSGVQIRASYRYFGGNGDAPEDDAPNSGGWLFSFVIEQTGQRIHMVDSKGHSYDGEITSATVPSGDDTGGSAGSVNARFIVSGVVSGQNVTMTGTFRGDYSPAGASDNGGSSNGGTLANRVIEGIWTEAAGTAQIFGNAADWRVDPRSFPSTSTTAAEAATATP